MFRRPTVFVIGAGASWHYGYPTGDGLIKLTRHFAQSLRADVDRFLKLAWFVELDYQKGRYGRQPNDGMTHHTRTKEECDEFINALDDFAPRSIDHFLSHKPALGDLGRMLIARALSECWKKSLERRPYQRSDDHSEYHHQSSDDWVRFVFDILSSGFDDPKELLDATRNDVKFITFNYDRSLERRLVSALNSSDKIRGASIAETFVSDERIVHVYGALREVTASNRKDDPEAVWNKAFIASQDICVIGGPDKQRHRELQARAKEWIGRADDIFVLGYGFDRTNSALIGLDQLAGARRQRRVFLTNFGNSNRLNQEVAQLLGVRLPRDMDPVTVETTSVSCTKSNKSVYRALEDDF